MHLVKDLSIDSALIEDAIVARSPFVTSVTKSVTWLHWRCWLAYAWLSMQRGYPKQLPATNLIISFRLFQKSSTRSMQSHVWNLLEKHYSPKVNNYENCSAIVQYPGYDTNAFQIDLNACWNITAVSVPLCHITVLDSVLRCVGHCQSCLQHNTSVLLEQNARLTQSFKSIIGIHRRRNVGGDLRGSASNNSGEGLEIGLAPHHNI